MYVLVRWMCANINDVLPVYFWSAVLCPLHSSGRHLSTTIIIFWWLCAVVMMLSCSMWSGETIGGDNDWWTLFCLLLLLCFALFPATKHNTRSLSFTHLPCLFVSPRLNVCSFLLIMHHGEKEYNNNTLYAIFGWPNRSTVLLLSTINRVASDQPADLLLLNISLGLRQNTEYIIYF